jgi:hypothetical protein
VTTLASPGDDDEAANRFKEEPPLATPNYSFEKRQRELAKKRKAEEKRQRKLGAPRADEPAEQGAQVAAPHADDPVPNDSEAKPAP